MKEATVIIPQFGQVDLTIACVNSLRQWHPHLERVLIVDDGSPAHSIRQLQQRSLLGTEIVRMPRRGGVTAAWNVGLTATSTPLVVFLNNDTVTRGPWLDQLLAPLTIPEEPALMTSPAMRRETLLPPPVRARLPQRRILAGWCMGIPAEVLRSLGGFDERLGVYFSDTDLQCRLIRRHPQALACVPGLPLVHWGHRTTRADADHKQVWRRDLRQFLSKWNIPESELRPGLLPMLDKT